MLQNTTKTKFTKKINGINISHTLEASNTNYETRGKRNIKYIVIHYTGNSKDLAVNNAKYFQGKNREASAHFFVDDTSIYQSVLLKNVAWHCGTSSGYHHFECRNNNSIGIEMCCTAGNYKISKKTIENAAHLCAELCKELKISVNGVDSYVLRHYDVTGKKCPAQMVSSSVEWKAFKDKVKSILNDTGAASTLYRVRKTWNNEASQLGAFSNLSNAKALADKNKGYYVFNSKGEKVYPITKTLRVGAQVKLIKSATYYDKKSIPSFIFNSKLYVREINGDRVVISTLKEGAVTGAVNKKYLEVI